VLVSHAHRFVFIHVQKTGGSAVTQTLHDAIPDLAAVPGTKHIRLAPALEQHPEVSDYFTMGFVRNPWERYYSWHAMVMRRLDGVEAGSYDDEKFARNGFWQRIVAEYPDFESFILRGTRRVQRLRVPQLDYLVAPAKRADFIGRTETLDEDLARGLRLAGLTPPAQVAHTNAGTGSDYREHYTPAMRERVAEVAAADIEAFGYEFSG